MKNKLNYEEPIDEQQLLRTLNTAIATSKRTLYNDGLLFILWGTLLSLGGLWYFINSTILVPSRIRDIVTILKPVTGILLILFTLYYVFFRNKKAQTYTAISTRYVWIGIIIAHNLNVIVTRNFLSEVDFNLLHPLQMVLIGFALFVTGGIYRYYLLSICGVAMWFAAYVCSGFELATQIQIRAAADLICFVVPGIFMLLASKKKQHV